MTSKTVLGSTLKAFTVKSRPHFVSAIVSIVVALAHGCRAQQYSDNRQLTADKMTVVSVSVSEALGTVRICR